MSKSSASRTSLWEYNAAWNRALAKSDAEVAVEANLPFQKGLEMLCIEWLTGIQAKKGGRGLSKEKSWGKVQNS